MTTKSRTYYNKQPNNNTEGLGIEFEVCTICIQDLWPYIFILLYFSVNADHIKSNEF